MKHERRTTVLLILALASAGLGSDGRAIGSASNRPPDDRQATGMLVPTADMSAARAAHTATALADGRVLIVGGFSGEENSAQAAEVYELEAARFVPTRPMSIPRHSHTATLLLNGKILIAGGYDAQTDPLASAELFDPETGSFTPTGSLVGARADHVAVLLGNGMVLIAGGVGPGSSFLSSAELYDTATGRFAATGSMTVARESHTAVRLKDDRVLVAGGHYGRGAGITLHASSELYDAVSGTFARAGDMRVRRHKHDAVVLQDGRVLITGGADERDNEGIYNSTELFDSDTSQFTPGPDMNLARYKHEGTSILLPNGMVLIAGGAPRAETYDPIRNVLTIVGGDARMAGQFSAAAHMTDGRALITGGYGQGRGPRASAWLYRP